MRVVFVLVMLFFSFVLLSFVHAGVCIPRDPLSDGTPTAFYLFGGSDVVGPALDFNPDYVKDTIKDRNFSPKAPYAFGDMLQLSYDTDLSGLDLCESNNTMVAIHNAIKLTLVDSDGKKYGSAYDWIGYVGETIDYFTLVEYSNPNYGSYWYSSHMLGYDMNLLQYQGGMQGLMEDWIKAIGNGKKFYVRISTVDDRDPVDVPIPLTTCVHQFGSGKIDLTFRRDVNAISGGYFYGSFLNDVDSIRSTFSSIDPMKTYVDKFSFYSDLALNKKMCSGRVDTKIFNSSGGSITFLSNNNIELYKYWNDGSLEAFTLIYSHEFGHAFANLDDEYSEKGKKVLPPSSMNCVANGGINIFSYNGLYYGHPYLSCAYTSGLNLRSTVDSIMRHSNSVTRFNVVSCGYLLSKILGGGSGPSYFAQCKTLDTIFEPLCSQDSDCLSLKKVRYWGTGWFGSSVTVPFYGCQKCNLGNVPEANSCAPDSSKTGNLCYAPAFIDAAGNWNSKAGVCNNGDCIDLQNGCINNIGCPPNTHCNFDGTTIGQCVSN